jgi:hypothetical protein
LQIISALSHLLPTAPHRPILALLPPPTPAEPTSTTTQYVQTIMVDDLPVLQEIVTLTEKEELIERDKEVGKRRMRIGGGPAGIRPMTKEQVEEKVFAEFAVDSKVRFNTRSPSSCTALKANVPGLVPFAFSYRNFTNLFSITRTFHSRRSGRPSTSFSSSTGLCSGPSLPARTRRRERERRLRRSQRASFSSGRKTGRSGKSKSSGGTGRGSVRSAISQSFCPNLSRGS